MKRFILSLLLLPSICFGVTPLGTATNPPVVQTAAATFTIQTGVTTTFNSGSITTFASGSTVNFTGATVTGLSGLPSQTGNANKILSTDGTNASWNLLTGANVNTSFISTFARTFLDDADVATVRDTLGVSVTAVDGIDSAIRGMSADDNGPIYSARNDSGSGTYIRSTTSWPYYFGLDLTGIAVYVSTASTANIATLISPRHVLLANHATPANGTTFRFVTSANAIVTRTLSSSSQIGTTDIQIGLLDSDVPNTISFFKVLPTNLEVSQVKRGVFWVDQDQTAYVSDIGAYVSTSGGYLSLMQSGYARRNAFYKLPVSGDSSHPVFMLLDGQSILLGAYFGVNVVPSIAANATTINTTMTSLGGGYQLTRYTTRNIPPPTTATALAFADSNSLQLLDGLGNLAADLSVNQLTDTVSTRTVSLDWGQRTLTDNATVLSVDWNSRTLSDTSGLTVLDWTNASVARASLGLAIGTNVQAYDADLTTWAGITPGAGVGTALALNIGSAGAPVTFNGALGTPSSGTLTSATGLPVSTGISGLGTGVATFLGTPSVANFKSALSDETTIVGNLLSLANPSAISFIKIAADNTVSTRTPAQVLSDIGAGTGDALVANPLSQFAATTSAQLRGVLSDENGTGAALFSGATSPVFVTPDLGTPSALVVTNASGTASININGTVGATTPAAGTFTTLTSTGKQKATLVTNQAEWGYDASNYLRLTIDSAGAATFANTGTNSGVTFNPTGNGGVTVSGTTNAGILNLNRSSGSNNVSLLFQDAGTTKGFFGIAGGANGIITGSATNDVCFRGITQNILFSADNGTTATLKLDTSNNATLAGNLTISGGTLTGGASGLSLAAGGSNQNITLTPSGTGRIKLPPNTSFQPTAATGYLNFYGGLDYDTGAYFFVKGNSDSTAAERGNIQLFANRLDGNATSGNVVFGSWSGSTSQLINLTITKSGGVWIGASPSDVAQGVLSANNITARGTLAVTGRATFSSGENHIARVVTAAGAVAVATTDYVVVVAKTSGASTTVNLPGSPTTGDTYIIKDGKFDAATNNITLTPASGNIENASTYVLNLNGQSATIIYSGTQWLVL